MSSKNGQETRAKNGIPTGLILYYHPYSYYSQKVLMALYEKNLQFEPRAVNIIREKQYEPWFLKINPRGEVPVLQDSDKIIPDSVRIIDYLEDNFSDGETPRLVPIDLDGDMRQKMNYLRQLVDKLPAGIITMGSFYQPELVKKPRIPFISPIRKAILNAERNSPENLKRHAEKNPEIKHVLIQKSYAQESKHKTMLSKEEYARVLASVDLVLDEVERHFDAKARQSEKDVYLISEKFTIADVSLTILLNRLYELGFESYFWTDDKRPHVEKYFEIVRQRESYKKTIPGKFYLIRSMIQQQAPLVLGISVVAAILCSVGAYSLLKKQP